MLSSYDVGYPVDVIDMLDVLSRLVAALLGGASASRIGCDPASCH